MFSMALESAFTAYGSETRTFFHYVPQPPFWFMDKLQTAAIKDCTNDSLEVEWIFQY